METLEELMELIAGRYEDMMDTDRRRLCEKDQIYQKDKKDLAELEDRLQQMGLTKKQMRHIYDVLACAQSVHERDLELTCQAAKETMKKILMKLLLSIINHLDHLDEQDE